MANANQPSVGTGDPGPSLTSAPPQCPNNQYPPCDISSIDPKALRSANAENPKGVRVLDSNKIWQKGPAVAGYLRQTDTSSLKRLLKANQKILDTYLVVRENNYYIGGPKKRSAVMTPKVWNRLLDESNRSWTQFTDLESIDYPNLRADEKSDVVHCVAMNLLISSRPGDYTDAASGATELVLGVALEDWFRALTLLKFNHKDQGRQGSGTNSSRPKNQTATPPVFLPIGWVDGGMSSIDDNSSRKTVSIDTNFVNEEGLVEQQRKRDREHQGARGWVLPSEDGDDGGPGADAEGLETEADKEAKFEQGLTNQLRDYASNMLVVQTKLAAVYTPVHSDAIAKACISIARNARIIWPRPEDEITLVRPTAEIDQLAAAVAQLGVDTDSDATSTKEGALAKQIRDQNIQEGDYFDATKADLNMFWDFQNQMNNASAIPPTYLESCGMLGLEPRKPSIFSRTGVPGRGPTPSPPSRFTFFPHQVQAIAWLKHMLESPLQGALLADDMGLGKTLTTLSTIEVLAQEAIASHPAASTTPSMDDINKVQADFDHGETGMRSLNLQSNRNVFRQKALEYNVQHLTGIVETLAKRRFKPTIVLGPANAIVVWENEITLNFPEFNLQCFYGSASKAGQSRKKVVVGSRIIDLLISIMRLPDSPEVIRTIYLTSYQTFVHRTTYWQSDLSTTGPKREAPNKSKDPDLMDEEELSEERSEDLRSYCGQIFGLVIADEAQKLKSKLTRTNRAVSLLKAEKIILLTATPMMNRVRDLAGLLWLLWRQDFARSEDDPSPNARGEEADGISFDAGEGLRMLSIDDISRQLWILDPPDFERKSTERRDTGHIRPADAYQFVPRILRLIQLKRTSATLITGVPDKPAARIGATIPPVQFIAIETQMTDLEVEEYASVHQMVSPIVGGGFDEETQQARRNMNAHRKLSIAARSTDLLQLARHHHGHNEIEAMYLKGDDYGARHLFKSTVKDISMRPYGTAVEMAAYLTRKSSALCCMIGLVHEICTANKRRVIIFTDWPATGWLVELILMLLQFQVISIRAAQTHAERDLSVLMFNDPESQVQVLVTSFRIASTALNLHKACSDVIFVEQPPNSQTANQAMGRINRLGQKRACTVLSIAVDHTYDQAIAANATKKMMAIIATSIKPAFTEEEILDQIQHEKERFPTVDFSSHDRRELAKQSLIDMQCASFYQSMFGQRSNRQNWNNVQDPTEKDNEPEESGFREQLGLPSDTILKPPPSKLEKPSIDDITD